MNLAEFNTLYEKIKDDSSLEKYDLIHYKIVEIIENNNIEDVISILKQYKDPTISRGILHTIMTTIKPILSFYNNEELHDAYEALVFAYKRNFELGIEPESKRTIDGILSIINSNSYKTSYSKIRSITMEINKLNDSLKTPEELLRVNIRWPFKRFVLSIIDKLRS